MINKEIDKQIKAIEVKFYHYMVSLAAYVKTLLSDSQRAEDEDETQDLIRKGAEL